MGSAGPQREGGLRRRASVETSCDTAPPHFPPKAGLSTACPPCRVVLAPWVWRPRPCPAASKGSLSVGIRCCPGRSRVLLWRLRPGCVPQGLGRAWGVFPELLPCPFPGSGNAPTLREPGLSGNFGGRRKAVRDRFALQGRTGAQLGPNPHPHPQPTMPWVSYQVGQPHTRVSWIARG